MKGMAQARGKSGSIGNVSGTLQHTELCFRQMRLVLLVTSRLVFVLNIFFTNTAAAYTCAQRHA